MPQLLEARHHCRGLTRDYNDLDTKTIPYDQVFEKRLELLRKLCGSTIGAGSNVTKDIPPFSVALGTPCRVKRTIQLAEEEEQDPEIPTVTYRASIVSQKKILFKVIPKTEHMPQMFEYKSMPSVLNKMSCRRDRIANLPPIHFQFRQLVNVVV
ncbi:hypothetical protein PENSUB_12691 [Penicillium subrubescens]|uniref:Maltose/galactoside acetyltransferase domain-containing protein n=1 Tax=Penicillium subrubescens TaxID=1316194 RepID=A0A1Q5SXT1_9EURO|nr:hypothetical protein PENSUB_12691 [Penicillium subrubescens]